MIEWKTSDSQVSYEDAVQFMEMRVEAIARDEASEMVWFLEHPPLLTVGTSGDEDDIKAAEGLPVYKSGRGGKVTYHGPGQRVVYIMLNLKKRMRESGVIDIRGFVRQVEDWIVRSLARFDVQAEPRCDRIGLWVKDVPPSTGESKIAAIGLRIRKGVSYHGVAINVSPDLAVFDRFVPCGISGFGVTSLKKLGVDASLADMDHALKSTFNETFNQDKSHAAHSTEAS